MKLYLYMAMFGVAGIASAHDHQYLYLTNSTQNCTLSFEKVKNEKNMHFSSGHKPSDIGTLQPTKKGEVEPVKYLKAYASSGDHNAYVTIEYAMNCGSNYLNGNMENESGALDITWMLKTTEKNAPKHSVTTNYVNGENPNYYLRHNLVYTVKYDSNDQSYWRLSTEKPTPQEDTLAVSSNYTDSNGAPYYSASFSDVSVDEILPFDQINSGSNCSTWACTTDAKGDSVTNGIYRINFSYDLSANSDDSEHGYMRTHPPVIGAFEIFKDSSGDSKAISDSDLTLVGKVSRDYAFMYKNSDGSVSLKDTFVFVNYATNVANTGETPDTLVIEGGYYDNTGVFHKVAESDPIELSQATDYPVDDSASYNIGVDLNDYSFSTPSSLASESADIAKNGMQQVKFLPLVSDNGNSFIIPARNASSTEEGNIYNHIVDLNGTNTSGSGASVISNMERCSESNGKTSCSSSDFETSYLESRYYCALDTANTGTITPEGCYAYLSPLNLSPSSDSMENSYPPISLQNFNSPPVPQYLSLRPTSSGNTDLYTPDACTVYYDSTSSSAKVTCASGIDGTGQVDTLNVVGGASDESSDSSSLFLTLGLNYDNSATYGSSYASARVTSAPSIDGETQSGVNYIDELSTIASKSDPWLGNTTDQVIDDSDVCYLYVASGNGGLLAGNDFEAKVTDSNGNYNITPLGGGVCGVYNDMLSDANGNAWVEGIAGSAISFATSNPSTTIESYSDSTPTSEYLVYSSSEKAYNLPTYGKYNDAMEFLQGWPVWNSWYIGAYDQGSMANEPFMLVMNAKSKTTVPGSSDTDYRLAYNQYGYANYSEDNLVVPFPAYVTSNINTDTNKGTGCSYLFKSDDNNISGLLNSWCEYLGDGVTSGLVNGNSISQSFSSNTKMKDYVPDMSDVYIVGLRDVMGDYISPTECQYQTDGSGNVTSSNCTAE
ncbi:hypothetical protein [Fangia hongkongensis]|uniref:hypothetical protein n=1 Tax=Fangia hongkongensis TaxID=270495 RepID=UPI000374EEA3|nr:hypothetical protein [Fangia hongkongensis]MBK2124882.1 hypothetical protein [Fangia hongkongensis]